MRGDLGAQVFLGIVGGVLHKRGVLPGECLTQLP